MARVETKKTSVRQLGFLTWLCAALLVTLAGCHKLLGLDTSVRVAEDGGVGPNMPDAQVSSDVAVVRIGEACTAEEEGVRACVAHASRGKAVCDGRTWRADGACDGDTRCQTQLGTDQGVCLPIAPGCEDAVADETFCAAAQLVRTCGIDLLDAQEIACGEDEACGPTTNGALGCTRADDCEPDPCNGHGQCTDGVLSFSCVCKGVWGNPTCDEQVPLFEITDVALDGAGDRVYVVDQDLRTLVAVDLVSGNRALVSGDARGDGPQFSSPLSLALDVQGERAYVADRSSSGPATLFVVELSTGNRAIVSDAIVGGGPIFYVPSEVALDVSAGRAYVLDQQTDALFSVDLTSGVRAVVSGPDRGTGTALTAPYGLSLDVPNQRAFVVDFSSGVLMVIDLSSGDRLTAHDVAAGEELKFDNPIAVDLDFNTRTAYVLESGTGSVKSVVLNGPAETLSGESVGTGPSFLAPDTLVVDARGGVLYVTDRDLDALFKVTLDGGHRTVVSDGGQGKGPSPLDVIALALDAERGVIYGWDISPSLLLGIELESGDRAVLFESDGQQIEGLGGLALDSASSLLYATNAGRRSLVTLDPTNGDLRVVSDGSRGTGIALTEDVGSLALDPAGGRVFVLDQGLDALLSVNIATGDRTVVSDASTGQGPVFDFSQGVDLDLENRRAYVLDDALLAVSLDNGDRTLVSGETRGVGPAFQSPGALAVDMAAGRAYVIDGFLDGVLLSVDLATGDRVLLSGAGVGSGPALMYPDTMVLDRAAGVAYLSNRKTIYAVDLATGDRIVVAH